MAPLATFDLVDNQVVVIADLHIFTGASEQGCQFTRAVLFGVIVGKQRDEIPIRFLLFQL